MGDRRPAGRPVSNDATAQHRESNDQARGPGQSNDRANRAPVVIGVGHPRLPFQQVGVLLLQAGEALALEAVAFDVPDLSLDLAFASRRVRLAGQNHGR